MKILNNKNSSYQPPVLFSGLDHLAQILIYEQTPFMAKNKNISSIIKQQSVIIQGEDIDLIANMARISQAKQFEKKLFALLQKP